MIQCFDMNSKYLMFGLSSPSKPLLDEDGWEEVELIMSKETVDHLGYYHEAGKLLVRHNRLWGSYKYNIIYT